MDADTLTAIQRELSSFEDPELWVLLELIVAEMQDRELLGGPEPVPVEPVMGSNRPE